ncbi:acidic phospholipase A2-like [Branchiostoma lanceolatum]|uniref:acidic phospholipase A2-like n=1 Tax=Branchiostoma lanceolatum TaxID=7740 RepID=UPI003451B283
MIAVTLSLIVILYTPKAEGHKKNHSKRNRSAYNLAQLIYCATRRNPLDYNGYGCWCGLGGSGQPMDDVDRCCKAHDECYTRVAKRCGSVFSYTASYNYRCKRGEIECTENSSGWWLFSNANKTKKCKTALCDCDKTVAECYARYPYNSDNYGRCDG